MIKLIKTKKITITLLCIMLILLTVIGTAEIQQASADETREYDIMFDLVGCHLAEDSPTSCKVGDTFALRFIADDGFVFSDYVIKVSFASNYNVIPLSQNMIQLNIIECEDVPSITVKLTPKVLNISYNLIGCTGSINNPASIDTTATEISSIYFNFTADEDYSFANYDISVEGASFEHSSYDSNNQLSVSLSEVTSSEIVVTITADILVAFIPLNISLENCTSTQQIYSIEKSSSFDLMITCEKPFYFDNNSELQVDGVYGDIVCNFVDSQTMSITINPPYKKEISIHVAPSVQKYNVEYDVFGGTLNAQPEDVIVGANLTYVFTPTNIDGALTLKIEGNVDWQKSGNTLTISNISADFKVIARSDIHYYICYDSNGGSGSLSKSEVERNVQVALPSNTFTREGYDFKGWSLTKDGVVHYEDCQQISNLAQVGKTVTLYAVWEIHLYKVTFMVGTNEYKIVHVPYNSATSDIVKNNIETMLYTVNGDLPASVTADIIISLNKTEVKAAFDNVQESEFFKTAIIIIGVSVLTFVVIILIDMLKAIMGARR